MDRQLSWVLSCYIYVEPLQFLLFEFVFVRFGDGTRCFDHRCSSDYFIDGFAMDLQIFFMILIANPKLFSSMILRVREGQSCARFCYTFRHFGGSIA